MGAVVMCPTLYSTLETAAPAVAAILLFTMDGSRMVKEGSVVGGGEDGRVGGRGGGHWSSRRVSPSSRSGRKVCMYVCMQRDSACTP